MAIHLASIFENFLNVVRNFLTVVVRLHLLEIAMRSRPVIDQHLVRAYIQIRGRRQCKSF